MRTIVTGIFRRLDVRRRESLRACYEQLETRQLMAVTTSLDMGSLTITGDAAADDIAIVGTARAGELVVTGRNGTPVNGVANGTATIFPVTGSLIANLNGGDDKATLDNLFVRGVIRVTSGDGNDTVTLGAIGEVSPADSVEIDAGAGNDNVSELRFAVFAGIGNFIELGPGDDIANVIGASSGGGRGGNSFGIRAWANSQYISGGEGSDSILVLGITAPSLVHIHGDSGINSVAVLYSSADGFHISSGSDFRDDRLGGGGTIYVDTLYTPTEITVSTAPGRRAPEPFADSSITVFRCLSAALRVSGGRGYNFVQLYGNAVNLPPYATRGGEPGGVPTSLSVGVSGPSTVLMTYNVGIPATVGLSDADDSLTLIGNSFVSATLNGGLGRNTLTEQYDSWGSLIVFNFG